MDLEKCTDADRRDCSKAISVVSDRILEKARESGATALALESLKGLLEDTERYKNVLSKEETKGRREAASEYAADLIKTTTEEDWLL